MADSTTPVTGEENLNIYNLTRKSFTLKQLPRMGESYLKTYKNRWKLLAFTWYTVGKEYTRKQSLKILCYLA